MNFSLRYALTFALSLSPVILFSFAAEASRSTQEELNGTARLDMAQEFCSAFVINVGRTDDAKAILATNGHCIRDPLLTATEVVGNFKFEGSAGIYGQTVSGYSEIVGSGIQVLYGTMKGTDVGILEIPTTNGELKQKGIHIFSLGEAPSPKSEIKVVSGAWRETYVGSVIGTELTIHEGSWEWINSFSFSDELSRIRGGYSGSPILDSAGNVVGILNTVFAGTSDACSEDNPCEVGKNGEKLTFAQRVYGQQIVGIKSCFGKAGEFDLSLKNCPLPAITQLRASGRISLGLI